MRLTLLLTLTICSVSQIYGYPLSSTVPIEAVTYSCKWTDWFNVDHPTEDSNGGDWETLGNITAQGFNVCQIPRDIHCRSVRFPYIPFRELQYNTTCDKSTGLTCLNKDNNVSCIDFEVQFLCCDSDRDVEHSTMEMPPVPTVPIAVITYSCKWTDWFNVDHPTEDSNGEDWETLGNITAQGFNVCQIPRDIHCRSVRFPYIPFRELQYNTTCDKSTGLTCLNKDNNVSCIDFEVQFLCCDSDRDVEHSTMEMPPVPTGNPTSCPTAQCNWSDWYNTHLTTSGPDGGDFENVTAILNLGYSICSAPQAAECRLVRFPYVPLSELYSTQECSASHGLMCLNKNQETEDCLDYEARFLCCTCDVTNNISSDKSEINHSGSRRSRF